jgi:Fe-S cluster biogenesis protein NfuA
MDSRSTEMSELMGRVEEVLEGLRPMLRMDGGDVELLAIEDGVVKLRLIGACTGCPMSTLTLKSGIERTLKQVIPEIERVEAD